MPYCDENGLYQAEYEKLWSCVPSVGSCDTMQGELIRAAGKIYHDYYNNGFGNAWCAPAAFLMDHIDFPESVEAMFLAHADEIICYGDKSKTVELMMDTVIRAAIDDCDPDSDSPGDMWDWSIDGYDWAYEDEYYGEDEDEYEY